MHFLSSNEKFIKVKFLIFATIDVLILNKNNLIFALIIKNTIKHFVVYNN